MKQALVLYGATDLGPPQFSGDLLWRTKFKAPDPFWLIETEGRSYLFLSPLELERGAKEAKSDEVISLGSLVKKADAKTQTEAIVFFLKEHGVEEVIIAEDFSYKLGKTLENHFTLKTKRESLFPERSKKNDWEIAEIEKAQRAVESAVEKAREYLAQCTISGQFVYQGGEQVTSETLRALIDGGLYAQGYLGVDTIVASGLQAADPHSAGSGPIEARSPIVIDVFPLSLSTHYYADQTRTLFKGEPTAELKKMYEAVLTAQKNAIAMVRAGVDGHDIMDQVSSFLSASYPTDFSQRPMEGFIHGVGHGVGIDIHESPSIANVHDILEEQNVVTIEPGLYYSKARDHIPVGGIRIEDMVVVTRDGCRNLTKMPKDLHWAIVP